MLVVLFVASWLLAVHVLSCSLFYSVPLLKFFLVCASVISYVAFVEPLFAITKTCLYNVDPLKPHFYIVKLGFTGVYIIILMSAQKHRLRILVRTASARRF